MKRKATGWEKIFPKHISSKGHVTGIIRAIYNLFFKWGKDFGVVYQKKKKYTWIQCDYLSGKYKLKPKCDITTHLSDCLCF